MPVVLKEIIEGVAIITLNRDEKMNAINREMALLLQQFLSECANDSSVRVILITAKGKAFCAGQDLDEASDVKMMKKILPDQLNPLVSAIYNSTKPVVAAVNGIAAGAGASIALCCDIIVAKKSAQFVQAFGKLGLVPDSGATFILPRMVGWQNAAALMMLGEKINGEQAEKMGMIYKCFDDSSFEGDALNISKSLAKMSPDALSLTKLALRRSVTNTFEQQLNVEDELQALALESDAFRQNLQAFAQRKKV